MEIFLSLLYTLIFLLLIHRLDFFKLEALSQKTLSFFFILKIIAGLAVWFIYTYYYTERSSNDVFKFYDDALIMFNAIHINPWHYIQMVIGVNSDSEYLVPYYKQMSNWYKPWEAATYHNNRIIIQFNALVHLFSFGYYNVHTVFMCFFSFLGLTGIYKTFYPLMKNKSIGLAVGVYLIPSVLFWGSGLLKEGIVIFSLGVFLYQFQKVINSKQTIGNVCIMLFTCAILCLTKVYVFVAIAPSLLALLLLKMTNDKYILLKFLSVHLFLFILAVNVYRINPNWNVLEVLSYKQWVITEIATKEGAGSIISTNVLDANVWSFLKNSPEAIINTLFRPHILESKTLFMLMSGIENLLLMLLIIVSFIFYKKPEKEALPLLYLALFFSLSLALIIGIVNPVLGSIVRFRVPLLSFFVIAFLVLVDKEKLVKKLPVFNLSFIAKLLR